MQLIVPQKIVMPHVYYISCMNYNLLQVYFKCHGYVWYIVFIYLVFLICKAQLKYSATCDKVLGKFLFILTSSFF